MLTFSFIKHISCRQTSDLAAQPLERMPICLVDPRSARGPAWWGVWVYPARARRSAAQMAQQIAIDSTGPAQIYVRPLPVAIGCMRLQLGRMLDVDQNLPQLD